MVVRSLFSGVALAGVLALPALAGTAAFIPGTLNGDPNYQAGTPVNLGNVFTANSNLDATALGIYAGANLTGPEQVGLYDSVGNLLASTTVNITGPVTNGYYYNSITPVMLTAGDTYTVVSQVNNNPWEFGTVTTPSFLTFLRDAYLYSATLQFTTNTGGSGPAYFGPNVQVGAVPEPAGWALMLVGIGLLGACVRTARRYNEAAAPVV